MQEPFKEEPYTVDQAQTFIVKQDVPVLSQPDPSSAGYDIHCSESVTIQPRSRKAIATKIKLAMPTGLCAKVVSRSGFSFKHGIEVGAGLIDPDYRGWVNVLLYNHSDLPFEIKSGDRIAQLLFLRYSNPNFSVVRDEGGLPPTRRDISGFGSSGV